jgi:putative NADH-flavin reductase
MSAYAILGATGSTGSSILQLLSASPSNEIHVLVRSKAKLEKVCPSASSNPNIKVFEGSISNADNLAQCLTGVKAVFLTVAVMDNIPGCSIAQDTAHAVVIALTRLKDENANFKPPRLVVLSSASVDDKFWNGIPRFVHHTLFAAMYYLYTDLQEAQAYLQSQEDWLSSTFITPGGISHDVQRGHALSESEQQTFISFLDVAAGMIEVADEESERWDGKLVCVVGSSGVKAKLSWDNPLLLLKGLVVYWMPWMYAYLH